MHKEDRDATSSDAAHLTDEWQRPELLRVDCRGAHDAPVQAGDALPAVEGRALQAALRLDDVDGELAAHDTREDALVGAAHALHAREGGGGRRRCQ